MVLIRPFVRSRSLRNALKKLVSPKWLRIFVFYLFSELTHIVLLFTECDC